LEKKKTFLSGPFGRNAQECGRDPNFAIEGKEKKKTERIRKRERKKRITPKEGGGKKGRKGTRLPQPGGVALTINRGGDKEKSQWGR